MGWKSTIDVTREEAVKAIVNEVLKKSEERIIWEYERLDNEKLEDVLYTLRFGDDPDKPYFGYNFNIIEGNNE